jgi:beta-mannosidase
VGEERVDIELGHVGFRELRLRRERGDFALAVNGCEIFCRGACWMPLDAVSLQAGAAQYEAAFNQVCAAGMNMLRVSGAGVYEQDGFLDLCDRRGVLLWQDFMFANMDYPGEDPQFLEAVRAEARQQLLRLQGRPALAILCGNSEVSQQAAMTGAAREHWYPALFESELAALAAELCADVPYCPSSTHGGAFPHQASAGVTSYYGVGAYLRGLEDARRSQLRFAAECLAFANVPEQALLDQIAAADAAAGGMATALRVHQARWKQRVPRDLSAGWDFDDVRDHYLGELFGREARELRYAGHERYLLLSRVVSGEVMAAAFGEWRRAGSCCRGALVWWLRDLWPGAGWGVIDAAGQPKAAYYYLKRVCQPLGVFISDEGNNGLQLHVVNDRPDGVAARLQLRLFHDSEAVEVPAVRALELAPHATLCLPATDLLEGFLDLSYAFRFGPPPYDLLHVRLEPDRGAAEPGDACPACLAEAFYFPLGLPRQAEADVGLSATLQAPVASADQGGDRVLVIGTRRFAQSVHIDLPPGCSADDQYFHLAPGASRRVRLRAPADGLDRRAVVRVSALNCAAACRALPG